MIRRGALVAVLALAGCAAPSQFGPRISYPAPYTDRGMHVVVTGLYENGYGIVSGVSGYARNDGPDLTTCMLTLELEDGSGAKVGEAIASTTGLRAGQEWRFQAVIAAPYMIRFTKIEPGAVLPYPPR